MTIRLGIDASNIRFGGGLVHLNQILATVTPETFGFEQVIVWGCTATLEQLPSRPWLKFEHDPLLEKSLVHRIFWEQFRLPKLAQKQCDLLFVPGGLFFSSFQPYVVMFQNMQIFEWPELRREGFSKEFGRLFLLQWIQRLSFKRSQGIIFLSQYSSDYLNDHFPHVVQSSQQALVPHGIGKEFDQSPRPQKNITAYNSEKPFKILYNSTVKKYKHPWNVIQAVYQLRKKVYPVELHLVGSGDSKAIAMMQKAIQQAKLEAPYIFYHGNQPYQAMKNFHEQADLCVYASSCETFGISLLEAMSSGLPIACSNKGPMPELLKDGGIYFNPESVASIRFALQTLLDDVEYRSKLAKKAYDYSHAYSWEKCANQTFSFLAHCLETHL